MRGAGNSLTPVNKPLLLAGFCVLVFMAALLSYYSGPRPVSSGLTLTEGGDDGPISFFGETYGEGKNGLAHSTDGKRHRNDVETEPKVVTEIKDVTDEKTVIIQRPEGQLDEASKLETDPEPEEEKQEEEKVEVDGEVTDPKDVEKGGDQPQSAEEELPDEVCNTSRRKEMIGIDGNHPRFQYVHVPKTGGTSIQTSMVAWVFHSDKKITLFKENGAGIRGSSFNCPMAALDASMLMGHRGYGFCQDIEHSPRGLFTFATFRKGASRIISLFDYNLWRLEPRALRVFGATPLNKLIKMYNSTPELDEGERLLRYHGSQQVRFMCGYECMGPNALKNETMTLPFMMQRAIANLKKVDVIGITEELNNAIIQLKFHLPFLKRRFGSWPDANEMSNRKKSTVDKESMAILEEWAKPDQQFYEIAKALYLKKDAIARKCLKD